MDHRPTQLARVLRVPFALLAAGVLHAHGGQYRGPTPMSGARDVQPLTASWQAWWEANKEPFLQRQEDGIAAPVTGSDDFYLGVRRAQAAASLLAIDENERRDRIVPALLALLEGERSRDVQTACLIGLAKVGRDTVGADLTTTIVARLARDDQEVRETAALSLGVLGRAEALPHLLALVRDERDGRRKVGSESVGERTRIFAAYGMALLARQSGDLAMRERVRSALQELLDDATAGRELRIAAVLGIGVLRPDVGAAADKRFAWQTVDWLVERFERDAGAGEEFVQAQMPLSIARLLGRGDSAVHRRCKRVFAETLLADSRRGNAILQSSAIALGAMAMPFGDGDDQAVAALKACYERGYEEHVRMYAVMAIGRIGGDAARSWLRREFAAGNRTMEKPWLAIALGMQAGAREGGDRETARMLLDQLEGASHEDLRCPLAVAVGLTRERALAPRVLAVLRDKAENERVSAYLCIALGLLGDPAAKDALVEQLEGGLRRPFALQNAAIALGKLGDGEVTTRLVAMMRKTESVAALASLAGALGRIGDRRAIDPLLELVRDPEMPKIGLAFVAASLGALGAQYREPWNQSLAVDANFALSVDTLSNANNGLLDIL